MNQRFIALYKEAETLLNHAPAMDDCSKEENAIYCALSSLQNALFDAGYFPQKKGNEAMPRSDTSSEYAFEHELNEYVLSHREEFVELLAGDVDDLKAKKPVLFKAICERVQEVLNEEDMSFDELRLDVKWMNRHYEIIHDIIADEANKFYYGDA